MKKAQSLFYLLLIVSVSLSAQHSLESSRNMYRAGDLIIKQQVDYKDPGRSGEQVLWDFSELSVISEEYKVDYFNSLRDPNLLSNDSIDIEDLSDDYYYLTGMEHRTRYNYTLQNDSLLLWGFNNPTTLIENSRPELQLRFPVAYGDSIKNHYYGHGNYSNTLEMDVMGTTQTVADAYGMMILPNKDTLKHVLRTRTLKIIAKDSQPITPFYDTKHANPPLISSDSIDYRITNDSLLFVLETVRWYQKGYRYPIFETVRSWEQYSHIPDYEYLATAFFYPPQEHYYLEEDEENLAVLEDEENKEIDPWEGLTWNIYPNPIKTDLNLELYLPRPVESLVIQVRTTMGMVLTEEQKGAYPMGTYSFTVNTYTLPLGNYILDVWLDGKLINQIIMKR